MLFAHLPSICLPMGALPAADCRATLPSADGVDNADVANCGRPADTYAAKFGSVPIILCTHEREKNVFLLLLFIPIRFGMKMPRTRCIQFVQRARTASAANGRKAHSCRIQCRRGRARAHARYTVVMCNCVAKAMIQNPRSE